MTTQSEMFGRLLRGAINSIAAYEGKTAAAVEEELGTAIGLSGAAIQRYKAGTLPPEPRTVQILAEASIQRGYLGRAWLQRFLQAAQFPMAADLIARLTGEGTTILPSGTLAFLFTDIAGSTQRWENERTLMEQALIRHDTLMRQAIELSGGQVFKTVGDAFYAVFATAPQALDAAIAAQRAILAEPWSTSTPIQVRMAIHVGAADPRDGDYFGAPLNRVARLCAAGHGGQMLISAAAWELVRDQLPEAVTLRELGERRLKDLGRPERIFQVVAPDLPTEFPRLNALDRYRHNLPPQTTLLIGRERETRMVCDLLRAPTTRLLTLTGPGGIGKTRLALQVAADLLDAYPDGVWFVTLAALRDPDRLAEQIATTLAVPSNDGRPVVEHVRAFLRHKSLLLVLDNFEQIVEAAPVVAELLADAPGVKALVTSRTVLHLYGEREFAVPPLGLPDPQRPPTPERLAQYDALRLFIERAQAVRPDFAVTNETAPVVAEICARLDGLPLAIELAAARSRLFAPRALLTRLERRLSVLTGGARNLPARHQTLRDTIAWSYYMLDIGEQTLFERLGTFVGGWTLEAAEQICGDRGSNDAPALAISLPTGEIAGLLESLARQSLIRIEEGPGGELRFTMLETIREFAQEQLAVNGDEAVLRDRHLTYYTWLAESTELWLRSSEQLTWLKLLEAEHDNLRDALKWSERTHNIPMTGMHLVTSLWYFWFLRSHLREARHWFDRMLAKEAEIPPEVRARALLHAAFLLRFQGEYEHAAQLVAQARPFIDMLGDHHLVAFTYALSDTADDQVTLVRQAGDPWLLAFTLKDVSWKLAATEGQPIRAAALCSEGLELARAGGDPWLIAYLLRGMAFLARKDVAESRQLLSESMALSQQLGDQLGLDQALEGMVWSSTAQADYDSAIRYESERLAIQRGIGNTAGIARSLIQLGELTAEQGDDTTATALFQEGLEYAEQLNETPGIARALMNLGSLAQARSHYAKATAHFVQALALVRESGHKRLIAMVLCKLGIITRLQNDMVHAVALLEEGLAIAREDSYQEGIAFNLEALGYTALAAGDTAKAYTLLLESLAAFRDARHAMGIAGVLCRLGDMLLSMGDISQATHYIIESLNLANRARARTEIARALDVLASVRMAQADHAEATRLWGTLHTLREQLSLPRGQMEQATYTQRIMDTRAQLGEVAFKAAWDIGQACPLDQAVADALASANA